MWKEENQRQQEVHGIVNNQEEEIAKEIQIEKKWK